MDFVKILQNLEPIFIESAQLALKMQKGVSFHNKYNTGNNIVDVVTEADLAVQEFLLKALSKTELINCRMFAEENTPSINKFSEQSKYCLSLDPIDGTAVYAKGGKYFSVIVTLHDGKDILYMFNYFPVFDYAFRVVNNVYSTLGVVPDISAPANLQNNILAWSGNPEKTVPEIYNEFKRKGVGFCVADDAGNDVDVATLYVQNKVIGVYRENMNVYDGLVNFAIAQALGRKIYSGGLNDKLDLSDIRKKETGFYYPGYYLVLNNLLN